MSCLLCGESPVENGIPKNGEIICGKCLSSLMQCVGKILDTQEMRPSQMQELILLFSEVATHSYKRKDFLYERPKTN